MPFWRLVAFRLCGCGLVASLLKCCVSCLLCSCADHPKPSRSSRCFLFRWRRLNLIFTKALEKLEKELDVLRVVKRVRMDHEILKSSLLCGKKRRRLMRHTQPCVVDVGTSDGE